jgi:CRP-like cAMP-binding protein
MIAIMSSALDDIFASAMTRRLSPGQSLFSVGDPVKVMIRVNFGAVALRRVTEQGTVLTLHVARRGEVLAEASLHSAHYHCEAAAREASEVALLPTHEFRDALRRDDDLVEIWVRILSRTVQETRMRAEIRTIRTVSDRLDAWLSLNNSLPPRGQLQELAAEIGTSREALYRELSRRKKAAGKLRI